MYSSRSNFKLSFSKPKYETNGTTVKCTLGYEIKTPDFFHSSEYDKDGNFNRTGQRVDFGARLGFHQAVGTAKLSDKDAFNKKTGREVAEARAESAAYKHANILIKKYITSVASNLVEMGNAFEKKTVGIKKHNTEFVASLVNFPEEGQRN